MAIMVVNRFDERKLHRFVSGMVQGGRWKEISRFSRMRDGHWFVMFRNEDDLIPVEDVICWEMIALV